MTAPRAYKEHIYVAKCTLCTFSSLVQKYTANSIAHKLGKEKSSFHEIKQNSKIHSTGLGILYSPFLKY